MPRTLKFVIEKGLDVRLPGNPERAIGERKPIASVALVGADHPGLSPSVLVEPGEHVRLGQALVRDRSGFVLTAPGTGRVGELRHGPRGSLASLVIELDQPAAEEVLEGRPPRPGAEAAHEALVTSGLWAALRERPFGRVPAPGTRPRSIFVTAIDTDPLAVDPLAVLAEAPEDFERGVAALTHLTDGDVHVCVAQGTDPPIPVSARVTLQQFAGPHPAGLPGTHMHLVDPVGRGRASWHVGYADVLAIGRLFRSGELCTERVVGLAGPKVARPRPLRARLGASVDDLLAGELAPGECRVVSGSVLSGRQATSWGRHLGRYDRGVCVLAETRGRPIHEGRGGLLRGLLGRGPQRGAPASARAVIPTGAFERVMPLDVLPIPLLRALLLGDLQAAAALGCLELVEEDLALCSYVCPSRIEYGAYLRAALERLEEAG